MFDFNLIDIEAQLNEIYPPEERTSDQSFSSKRNVNFYYSSEFNPYCSKEINNMFVLASQRSALGRANSTKKLDESVISNLLMEHELKKQEVELKKVWQTKLNQNDNKSYEGYDSESSVSKQKTQIPQKSDKTYFSKRRQSVNIQIGSLQMISDSRQKSFAEIDLRNVKKHSSTLTSAAKPPSKTEILPDNQGEQSESDKKSKRKHAEQQESVEKPKKKDKSKEKERSKEKEKEKRRKANEEARAKEEKQTKQEEQIQQTESQPQQEEIPQQQQTESQQQPEEIQPQQEETQPQQVDIQPQQEEPAAQEEQTTEEETPLPLAPSMKKIRLSSTVEQFQNLYTDQQPPIQDQEQPQAQSESKSPQKQDNQNNTHHVTIQPESPKQQKVNPFASRETEQKPPSPKPKMSAFQKALMNIQNQQGPAANPQPVRKVRASIARDIKPIQPRPAQDVIKPNPSVSTPSQPQNTEISANPEAGLQVRRASIKSKRRPPTRKPQ